MDAVSFDNLAAVAAVAFIAPLLLGLAPALRVPSVLLEIGAGVVLGPSVLGWVQADAAVNVLSLIGVGFLLLLAGLEIEVDRLRGAVLRLALTGFAISFAIAVAVGYGLDAAGIVGAPFLVAVMTEAGFGFFIPVFFVASGLRLDAGALVSDSSTLLHVPVLVAAIYVIRGLPAILYAGLLGARRALAAGLLQSTTLSFVLIASQIGQELGLLGSSDVAALTAAALVSVLVNPVVALAVLGTSDAAPSDALATASP
jgi:Kef-type K+ transport system membrane component KefB